MKSVPVVLDNIISESPFLEELISLKIVNLSGLARELKDTVEERCMKPVTEASMVMALKRLADKSRGRSSLSSEVFQSSPELIVRSNLFEVTIENSTTSLEKQKKLLAFANRQHNPFITFTHGLFETTTVASNQVKAMAISLYEGEKIISVIENVSTITIKFGVDIVDSPFIYHTVLRTLAWAGISLAEVVSTYSELTIILKNKDVELAFALIKKLFTQRD